MTHIERARAFFGCEGGEGHSSLCYDIGGSAGECNRLAAEFAKVREEERERCIRKAAAVEKQYQIDESNPAIAMVAANRSFMLTCAAVCRKVVAAIKETP